MNILTKEKCKGKYKVRVSYLRNVFVLWFGTEPDYGMIENEVYKMLNN